MTIVGRFALATLLSAGATSIALLLMLLVREAIDTFVRKTILGSIALPALGSIGAIAFLVEMVNEGYALAIPGVILSILCILVFNKESGAVTTITKLVESSGIVFMLWLLKLGWQQFFADWTRFLSIVAGTFGAEWPTLIVLFLVATFCVSMYWLFGRRREMEQRNYSKRMQDAEYKKFEEEKSQLEQRLRGIEQLERHRQEREQSQYIIEGGQIRRFRR